MACFTGQDPEVAALTAGNAARYNALAVSEKTRDVLVSLDEIEEELKSFDFEEHRIEEGRGDQEETGKRIALEKKKRSLFVHKTGEKLLEQYAKLADWGIEKLEKNPDAAKMIDVVLLSFATYQQLMMELPERLTTGDAKRTQKAQKELDRALKSGTEAIREHLNKSGYSKEEQLVYAHAVAGPLLLLKTAVSKGKKGTSTAPSQELLTSLKDFKKAHGALKTKASMGEYRHTGGHHVLEGNKLSKNVPPVLQKLPNFTWTVKEIKNSDKIGRHPKFGNIYKDSSQKIGNKDIYWLKDNAKHGGSEYKLYEEAGKKFLWIGDIDNTGKVVLKHKSNVGRVIPHSEIIWRK